MRRHLHPAIAGDACRYSGSPEPTTDPSVSAVAGMPGVRPAALILASVVSMASATGGALGLPGKPIDCDRSDGPMKNTSMPSTARISSTLAMRLGMLELHADQRLGVGGGGEIRHARAEAPAVGPRARRQAARRAGAELHGRHGASGHPRPC